MECARVSTDNIFLLSSAWRTTHSIRAIVTHIDFCLIYSTRSANFKLCLLKGDHYHSSLEHCRRRRCDGYYMVYGYELMMYLCRVNEDRRAQ